MLDKHDKKRVEKLIHQIENCLWMAYTILEDDIGYEKQLALERKKVTISAKNLETANKIIETVCSYFDLSPEDVRIKTRVREILYPRQVCIYFICEITRLSLIRVASLFNQNHATVIHSCKAINNLLDTDAQVREDIIELTKLIKT